MRITGTPIKIRYTSDRANDRRVESHSRATIMAINVSAARRLNEACKVVYIVSPNGRLFVGVDVCR